MSRPIKYTEAEQLSFALVPETCYALEKAFDKLLNVDMANIDEIFAKYNLKVDPQLRFAMQEFLSRKLFIAKTELDRAVKYQGTFPLRLALVEQMEEQLRAQGKIPEESNYRHWMDVHNLGKKDEVTS